MGNVKLINNHFPIYEILEFTEWILCLEERFFFSCVIKLPNANLNNGRKHSLFICAVFSGLESFNEVLLDFVNLKVL
jgi:hypothetical protein